MTFPTPAGTVYEAAPKIFASPPQVPGINTSTFPTVTTPAVPATTVKQANTTGVDVMVYVTSGGAAVTAITVNATATGLNLGTATTSSASVYLPAGATISLTYASTAPTWVWLAV
jgi:hypothetical protein